MNKITFFLLHIAVLASLILLAGTGLALLMGYEMRKHPKPYQAWMR